MGRPRAPDDYDGETADCSICLEEVVLADYCAEHEACLWCDVDCRLEAATEAEEDG